MRAARPKGASRVEGLRTRVEGVRARVHDGRASRSSSGKRIADKVAALEIGDRVNAAGHVELSGVAGAKLRGTIMVAHDAADEYVVNAELDAKVGVTLIGDAYAGAAIEASFAYEDAEGASRAVDALVPFGPGHAADLKGHLRRIELGPTANLEFEAKLGLGFVGLTAKARFDPSFAYALVFKDDATYLERVMQLDARAEGKAVVPLMTGGVGVVPDVIKGSTRGVVQITSRIKLPEHVAVKDAAKAMLFVADPLGLTDGVSDATHELSMVWETELRKPGDDTGFSLSVKATDVSAAKLAHAVPLALSGDVEKVQTLLGVEGEAERFTDHGPDWEFDLGLGPVGLEFAWRNELRRYEPLYETTPKGKGRVATGKNND